MNRKKRSGRTGASRRTISLLEVSHWHVAEADDFMLVVRRWQDGEEVIVELQQDGPAWACSACGLFRITKGSAGILTCEHVGAASRDMPTALALQIARIITPARSNTLSTKTGGAARGAEINEAALAAALAKSAAMRAERVRRHDRMHQSHTAGVVTRQATPEDIERVRLIRERRGRLSSQ